MIKSYSMKYSVLIMVFLMVYSCKKEKQNSEHLGVVSVEISGKEKAISYFEKGLLLLHSFEYEDAREAFKQAQDRDPKMPMAYWGEAMTYNHSLWGEQDYESARSALDILGTIKLDKQVTELEKDFIKAVQILYQPKTDKPERDVAYANFMEGLAKKYPANHEVAAFYALSLLGSVPEGRDDVLYGKGAKIAEGILQENPKHPGALHYLIHSYDDPGHATFGLEAANAYSKVAPDASHALHMPSHIYVAMGMWDEVIASNIDSYQASLNRMERKNLDNDARGYHAYHWLEYGHLQKGNFEEAKKMAMNMRQYSEENPSKRARVHMVFLKGTYLVGTNDWIGDIADIKVDIADLNVSVRSQYHFLEGMKYYKSGNKEDLDGIISKIETDSNRATFIVTNSSAKLCSGVTRDEANETDITKAKIRQLQLKALASDLNNNMLLAEEYFLESISLEESISYSFGPPSIQKPTHELYADWLLSQNRNEEAIEHYKLGLKAAPKRFLALKGIEKANKI